VRVRRIIADKMVYGELTRQLIEESLNRTPGSEDESCGRVQTWRVERTRTGLRLLNV